MNWYIRHLRGTSIVLVVVGVELCILAFTWPLSWALKVTFVVATAWHLLLAFKPHVLRGRDESDVER